MADKRCYNKSESIQYFGIDLSSFETYIEPELEGMGIKIGDCLVYEAYDLDKAWDAFKKKSRETALASPSPPQTRPAASSKKAKGPSKEATPSPHSGSIAWNAAVTKVLEKGKPRKK